MIGPGKYGDVCEDVRIRTKAKGVILIIGGGNLGDGFSVAAETYYLASLPAVLRNIADEIEKDRARGAAS